MVCNDISSAYLLGADICIWLVMATTYVVLYDVHVCVSASVSVTLICNCLLVDITGSVRRSVCLVLLALSIISGCKLLTEGITGLEFQQILSFSCETAQYEVQYEAVISDFGYPVSASVLRFMFKIPKQLESVCLT